VLSFGEWQALRDICTEITKYNYYLLTTLDIKLRVVRCNIGPIQL